MVKILEGEILKQNHICHLYKEKNEDQEFCQWFFVSKQKSHHKYSLRSNLYQMFYFLETLDDLCIWSIYIDYSMYLKSKLSLINRTEGSSSTNIMRILHNFKVTLKSLNLIDVHISTFLLFILQTGTNICQMLKQNRSFHDNTIVVGIPLIFKFLGVVKRRF